MHEVHAEPALSFLVIARERILIESVNQQRSRHQLLV